MNPEQQKRIIWTTEGKKQQRLRDLEGKKHKKLTLCQQFWKGGRRNVG
jgi:hypothetical protein